MTIKQLDHLNFSVSNLEESVDWYQRLFGFEQVERGASMGVPYSIIKSGDAMLCMYEHPDRRSAASVPDGVHRAAHIGFRITDGDSWEALMEAEEVLLDYGPTDYPHSKSWYVRDPSGYQIEVVLWKDDQIRFAS